MIRRLISGILVTGVVIVGLLAQAGAHLLALTPPATPLETPTAGTPFTATGPHAVGVRSIGLDAAPMPLTMWYPAVAASDVTTAVDYSYGLHMVSARSSVALATYTGRAQPGVPADETGGPFPLVVFSHGFAITANSYGWLAEHLASHGLVVVAPHHEESLDPETLWRSTIERPRDIASVLQHVERQTASGGDFEGLIDEERVAVVGHSYGGYTALAAAGATVDAAAFEASCEAAHVSNSPLVFLCDALLAELDHVSASADSPSGGGSGVRAVVSIAGDAAMFGEPGLDRVTVPVMAIGGTADTDSPYEWSTRLSYEHVSSARKAEVGLQGAGHMVFAGGCDRVRRVLTLVSMGFCSDPEWDRDLAQEVVKHYATAFLMAELTGGREATSLLEESESAFSDVVYRTEGY